MLAEMLLSISTLALIIGFTMFGLGVVLDYERVVKIGIITAILGAGALGVTISLALILEGI